MSKAHPPELRKFMDKKLSIKVNGGKFYHATDDDAYLWLIIFRPKSWRHASRIWSIHELGHWWCYRVPKGKFQTTFYHVTKTRWPWFFDHQVARLKLKKKDSSSHTMGMCVIRGNSVLMIEALERIWNQSDSKLWFSKIQVVVGKDFFLSPPAVNH